ncbi:MAG: amino acid adenylation domain-containing protein [Bacteroidota bacterium]
MDRNLSYKHLEIQQLLYRLKEKEITLSSVNGKPAMFPEALACTEMESALLDKYLHTSDCKHLIGKSFSETADSFQHKTAIYYNGQTIPYGELEIRSNKVADYLSGQGLNRSDVIAVCLSKSIDMVAIILGIFKSGFTYLPIDRQLPVDRKRYMLSDSNCRCIITSDAEFSQILDDLEKNVKQVTEEDVFGTQYLSELDDSCTASQEDIAYIIYTSGSTGQPKGVEVSQKAISEHIYEISKQYGITSADRFLQFSNFSFDPSIEQIFCTLTNGATLFLADDDLLHSDLIIEYLINQKITFFDTAPKFAESIFTDLFSNHELTSQLSLKTLIVGGEAISANFCREWAKSLLGQKCNLINAYGPTETTISATIFKIPGNLQADEIPIGKPIRGTKAFIVDEEGRLLTTGERGELYFAGSRLATGYKGRPEETALRFVYPAFANGERCYRTGDLASWDADGNLLFHGRVDNQVKIRGYRVEPQEIEASLNRLEMVEDSRVLPQHISTGIQLVAFLKSVQNIDIEVVKEELKKQLPGYMIPAQLIVLPEFPLNFNGKIADDVLLAKVDSVKVSSYLAPKTSDEIALVQIWEDVLKVNRIGITDDFFDLGGHSISAIRIISQIRSKLQKKVTLSAFYQNPTIQSLSGNLKDANEADDFISKGKFEGLRNVSPAQKGLWLQLQFGYLKAYHITGFYQLNTKIDVPMLQLAIEKLVEQHEIFRTSFVDKLGRPFLKIHESSEVELKTHHQPINDQLITEFTDERFDLNVAPLIRFSVFGISSETQTLGIVVSHLISDGWSMTVMLHELVKNYETLLNQGAVNIDPERLQYSDYVAWQDEYRGLSESSLEYWKSSLEGFQFLNLPTDYSHKKQNSEKGSFFKIDLGQHLSGGLREYATSRKQTPFTTCFAAIYLLLSKFCNQQDICIGLPIANRDHSQLEDMIGFLVNSMVVRINPDNNAVTFNELTDLVNDQILNARNHQNVSFDQLVMHLKPERNGVKNPFFNVQVNYVPLSDKLVEGEQVSLRRIPYHNKTSKFDLTFEFEESVKGDISIGIEYNITIFSEKTIEVLLNSLKSIIQQKLDQSDEKASSIDMIYYGEDLDERDDRFILTDLPNLGLHQLVEKQFELSAENTALSYGTKQISYKELGQKVNCLAGILLNKGIKSGDVVTVLMDRSFEMVIAFLSIMKAGAAYMPASKDLPVDRISYMISNSSSCYLIGSYNDDQEISEILESGGVGSINTIFIDADNFQEKDAETATFPEIDQQDSAYILYTSGSTGRPKGVEISHEAIVNHMYWMESTFGWKSDEVFIQKTAVTFDASVWEFYLPLMMGNQLVLSENGDQTDPDVLVSEIQQHRVSVLQGTPTLLEYLNKQGAYEKCDSLRWLFSGGEALKVSTASALKSNINGHLINLYGPTECTIDATYYEFIEDLPYEIVPIGKAISNMIPMVLDADGNLLPDGFVGELCFAGYGIAKGYINQSQLTEKSFLSVEGVLRNRYYKTGDIARIDQDGFIHYKGRKDHQLKIRGVRIEAGEIEAALASFKGVVQVGVVLAGNVLIAYFESSEEIDSVELKVHAAAKLPAYMLPAYFIRLDELPRTNSGKLDRRKLQQLEIPGSSAEIVKPDSETERQILNIWLNAFGVGEISVLDNFFEIGGHSLIGMQIVSKIKNEMMFAISLKDLFEQSNIRALSSLIDSEGDNLVTEQEEDIISNYGQDSHEFII